MKPIIYQVDSFTNKAFYGNPAAVCILKSPIDDETMQKIAAEMNLAETAFVWAEEKAFRLRWFTPAVEVSLCGHATLATAHVLFEKNIVDPSCTIAFNTLSGQLIASKGSRGIELDFPMHKVKAIDASHLELAKILGEDPVFVGVAADSLFVELKSAEAVKRLRPDLKKIGALEFHAVSVSAVSTMPEFDFISRNFAPAVGIDEDPVTGSAHCALAPYYAAKLNKTEMVGYQASLRGGVVGVKLAGDRVILSGGAVTVLEGTLLVDL